MSTVINILCILLLAAAFAIVGAYFLRHRNPTPTMSMSAHLSPQQVTALSWFLISVARSFEVMPISYPSLTFSMCHGREGFGLYAWKSDDPGMGSVFLCPGEESQANNFYPTSWEFNPDGKSEKLPPVHDLTSGLG